LVAGASPSFQCLHIKFPARFSISDCLYFGIGFGIGIGIGIGFGFGFAVGFAVGFGFGFGSSSAATPYHDGGRCSTAYHRHHWRVIATIAIAVASRDAASADATVLPTTIGCGAAAYTTHRRHGSTSSVTTVAATTSAATDTAAAAAIITFVKTVALGRRKDGNRRPGFPSESFGWRHGWRHSCRQHTTAGAGAGDAAIKGTGASSTPSATTTTASVRTSGSTVSPTTLRSG
jgi:hypothetical protein